VRENRHQNVCQSIDPQAVARYTATMFGTTWTATCHMQIKLLDWEGGGPAYRRER
jgi:hypothetical protein